MRNTLFLIIALTSLAASKAAVENKAFVFYGRSVEVPLENQLQNFKFEVQTVNFTKVNSQLKAMHKLGLEQTFTKLKEEARQMKLDKVGYFQLIKVFSMQAFPNQSADFRKALAWYGLRHDGVDVILVGSKDYFNIFVRL